MTATPGTAGGVEPVDHGGRDAGLAGRLFWSAVALGWVLIGFGVWGVLVDRDRTNPSGLATWVAGGLLAHDLLVAPVATAAALLLARRAAPSWRGPVTVALVWTVLVVAFAYPLLRGFGLHESNPSALPRSYGPAVLAIVAVIWATAIGIVVWRRWSR